MQRKITLNSSEVNKAFIQTPDQWSLLLAITTPQGATFDFGQALANIEAAGNLWMLLKLLDSSGAQVPASTMLGLAKLRAGVGDFYEQRIVEFPYAGYYDTPSTNQRNSDFHSEVVHPLGYDLIRNPQYDQLLLYIKSPVVPDLTQATTLFETVVDATY